MQQQLSNLFEPYQLGDVFLPNRIIMAPLTRCRCDIETGIPTDLNALYYSQRASAGLIITECTPVAKNATSFAGVARIYTKEQVQGWKKVTEAVHAKGGRIFNQIWHAGRAAHPALTGEQNIAPSAIAIRGNLRSNLPHVVPREMTKEDIELVKEQFRQAAINAKEADFDGVELHGAGGYLLDQFLRDSTNKRTDEYGGSVENRCRLTLEITDIFIEVFGKGRVGVKVMPVGRFQDMYDSDPVATYSYLLKELEKRGIAYVQLMEPDEVFAQPTGYGLGSEQIAEVCKTLRPFFKGTIIMNNNLTPEIAAKKIAAGDADLASFGRYFISNPDFVERVQNGWDYNEGDATTFYSGGAKGYVDYPFYGKEPSRL